MASISPIGRVSFPSVFEPNEFNNKKSYELTLLFDKSTDITVLKKAAEEAVKAKWGDKPPKGLQNPFKDGDKIAEEKDRPEYEGMIAVKFKTGESKKPQVVDAAKRPIDPKSGAFYPGCYAHVSFSAFAWENDEFKTKGVSFALGNVQKVRDGESFDGRTDADDDFTALEDANAGGEHLF